MQCNLKALNGGWAQELSAALRQRECLAEGLTQQQHRTINRIVGVSVTLPPTLTQLKRTAG